jgi:hypothetical protein
VHIHIRNGPFIREVLQQMHDGAMRDDENDANEGMPLWEGIIHDDR